MSVNLPPGRSDTIVRHVEQNLESEEEFGRKSTQFVRREGSSVKNEGLFDGLSS